LEYYFQTREEWRDWLERNHKTAAEAWLICYKKNSGRARIPYDETVEEALCFGWIDGKIKSVNREYFLRRFTPRKKNSRWSKYNIDRVEKLREQGLMKEEGLKAYEELLRKPHLAYDNRADGPPEIPPDLMQGLESSRKALGNFMNFSPSSRKIYIEWLNSAKRPETREKRIARIIDYSERNIKPGITTG
jgi:uncharacterized protein YdeI (YjbR/CyaY-like superfamily)